MVSSSQDQTNSPSVAPESDNMVERVAKAIAECMVACGAIKYTNDATSSWAVGPSYLAARKAIEAMREPTQAMVTQTDGAAIAGWNRKETFGPDGRSAPERVVTYRAMIDKALEE